jgi:hypothetical protein
MYKKWYAIVITALLIVLLTTTTVLASPASSGFEGKKTPSNPNAQGQKTKAPAGNVEKTANPNKTFKTVNYRGYVVAASAASLTITTEKESTVVTFMLTAETTVHVPTLSRAALITDIKVNDFVNVHGKLDTTTQVLTATSLNVVPGQTTGKNGEEANAAGAVTDYQTGVSITILNDKGEPVTYLITETTQFLPADQAAGITPGAVVVVIPVDPTADPLVAGTIVVSSPEELGTPMGVVTDYQPGMSITITDKDAVETTYLLTETTILLPAELAATLAVGDTVAITPVDPKAEELTAALILVQAPEVTATPDPSETPVP